MAKKKNKAEAKEKAGKGKVAGKEKVAGPEVAGTEKAAVKDVPGQGAAGPEVAGQGAGDSGGQPKTAVKKLKKKKGFTQLFWTQPVHVMSEYQAPIIFGYQLTFDKKTGAYFAWVPDRMVKTELKRGFVDELL